MPGKLPGKWLNSNNGVASGFPFDKKHPCRNSDIFRIPPKSPLLVQCGLYQKRWNLMETPCNSNRVYTQYGRKYHIILERIWANFAHSYLFLRLLIFVSISSPLFLFLPPPTPSFFPRPSFSFLLYSI